MPRIAAIAVLALLTSFVPSVGAGGLLPVNPIVNGDFDMGVIVGGLTPAHALLDQCVGIGHQAYDPLYSSWADFLLAVANGAAGDPTTLVDVVTADDFVEQATAWPAAHAIATAEDPSGVPACDAPGEDTAQLNPWRSAHDRGVGWNNDPGTTFYDVTDDGDIEAVIPTSPTSHEHSLWQSVATPTQAFSADFEAFAFAIEAGTIPARASIQIGLSLSPGYMQHPWVGVFWEGAVLFRAGDMAPDADGLIRMDPVLDGEIICPGGYPPCTAFKADYDAATPNGKRALLGQARVVQTSFWAFHDPAGIVALDDVAYLGAKTAAETAPNLGNL